MLSRLLAVSVPCVCLLSGCASTGGYVSNRLRDITDVAHVDGTAMSMGAVVNIGPAVLGSHALTGMAIGMGSNQGVRYKVGFGGIQKKLERGVASGVIVPLSRIQSSQLQEGYASKEPTWGSIGFDLGCLFGIGVHVDFVELFDCLTGFVGIDLLDDDETPNARLGHR